MKAKRPRASFMLSRELLEAAAACGKHSDVAAGKAMRSATRRLIREQQYRTAMRRKAQGASETTSGSGAVLESNEARHEQKEIEKMNVREFIGTFLKPEDVATPVVLTIADVAEGKYGLDLTFDDGSKMGLNATNGRKLAKAWGYESEAWIGKQIELSAGTIPFDGEDRPTIALTPISPAMSPTEQALAKRDPIDDDMPFN